VDGVLSQALIYLCAAAIAVPLAARLGLGSVLGYLIAGIAIGPLFGIVGTETETLQHYAEFGVVMMLFLVGLELQPRMLWDMRGRLLGLGGAQLALCAAAMAALLLVFEPNWRQALAGGVILALSSTAIVLQSLRERGLMLTEGGRASFAILLFQDIAVIPIIALLPLLADPVLNQVAGQDDHAAASAMAGLAGWLRALITLGAVALVVALGRYAVRPSLRFIASLRMREMFTVAALLLVVGIAYLMTFVGLSPALGAFVAGVVLADSEFRHELEADIEPFKGLLLGLFFITVGAGVDLQVLVREPVFILAVALALVVIKAAMILPIAAAFRLPTPDRWLAALSLAQGGEFAFVLFNVAVGAQVMGAATASALTMAVTLSMLVTPALFVLHQRVIQPRYAGARERADDEIDEQGLAIVAGLGRFGQITQRLLRANGVPTVVLDHSSAQVDTLAIFGVKGYFGDAARPEMLKAAGIENAKVLVVAIDDQEKAIEIVRHVRRDYPEVFVIARAFDRVHYYRLREAGGHVVIRELFGSSMEAAQAALTALGIPAARAQRMLTAFRRHDENTLEALFEAYLKEPAVEKNQDFISRSRAAQETLAEVLATDAPADEA
jgi:monovalent cation:proton antiporter-2 (CPA2) family protein